MHPQPPCALRSRRGARGRTNPYPAGKEIFLQSYLEQAFGKRRRDHAADARGLRGMAGPVLRHPAPARTPPGWRPHRGQALPHRLLPSMTHWLDPAADLLLPAAWRPLNAVAKRRCSMP